MMLATRFSLLPMLLVFGLFALPAYAQSPAQSPASEPDSPSLASSAPPTTPGSLRPNPRAALIEVVPPAAIQQSPAAVTLIDRLMRKHELLLQHPSLIAQVVAAPNIATTRFGKQNGANARLAEALRVRVIPNTNIIEVLVDPAVAGDEAATLAEAVVNQHLENQRQIVQDRDLERSVMLNNLKQRYQFREDELRRELHEKVLRLSIDGMGMPGRLSAKELELKNLLQRGFEMERNRSGAAPEAAPAIDVELKQVRERIETAKADLGDLINALNQYLAIKDDEAATRKLLNCVTGQLDQLAQNNTNHPPAVRWLCRPSGG